MLSFCRRVAQITGWTQAALVQRKCKAGIRNQRPSHGQLDGVLSVLKTWRISEAIITTDAFYGLHYILINVNNNEICKVI